MKKQFLIFFIFLFQINIIFAKPGDLYNCADTKGELEEGRFFTILWNKNKTIKKTYLKLNENQMESESNQVILVETENYFLSGSEYQGGVQSTTLFESDDEVLVIRTFVDHKKTFSQGSVCYKQKVIPS